ncbi:MAG: hypothetical protein KF857_05690 [Fimbriimonadaceae bacterium]|nr:hypothetical protein [Fimbriimonadaceae bacterium]
MKTLTLTAACLILAVTSANVALAQRAPGHANPKADHHRVDPSDALMRQAAKEIQKAHGILQHALPIYSGHRVNAMVDCVEADKQIALGLRYDRRHNEGQAPANTPDNASPSRYTKEQVAKSNNMLKKAAEVLAHAKEKLSKGNNEYGGHRVEAIKQVDQALAQIRQALASLDHRP